jgi:hypothetical protein
VITQKLNNELNKMIIFAHRINTINEMKALPDDIGAEIDVRDYRDCLVAAHDAFVGGELFEDVLSVANQRQLIINVKSEGIENEVIRILTEYNIDNYFLLDCSFPAIVKLCKQGIGKIALRYSEFEGMDTLVNMKGAAEWVWVDCFSKNPFELNNFIKIKNLGYKICLVSPDLLGRPEQISHMVDWLKLKNYSPDAVCVKSMNIKHWMQIK